GIWVKSGVIRGENSRKPVFGFRLSGEGLFCKGLGLPVGTQFAAAHGREDTLLSLAAQLEQIQPWVEIPQVV
ncbi:MAG: hypothetical protein KH936_00670, partial [Neisseria sp.]|nr:hypothetical protein [Neisseria sp.]